MSLLEGKIENDKASILSPTKRQVVSDLVFRLDADARRKLVAMTEIESHNI